MEITGLDEAISGSAAEPVPDGGGVLAGRGPAADALRSLWGRVQSGRVSSRALLRLDTAPGVAESLGGSPLLTADVISSQCTSNGDGSSGSSTLVGVSVAGSPVAVNPAPNTTIDVLGAITVTLNEQIVSGSPGETSITVNAVHVRLNLDGIATGDVILSQSRCRAAGPDVVGGGPGAATPATPVTANPNLTG